MTVRGRRLAISCAPRPCVLDVRYPPRNVGVCMMISFVLRAHCLPFIEDALFPNTALASHVLGVSILYVFENPFPARDPLKPTRQDGNAHAVSNVQRALPISSKQPESSFLDNGTLISVRDQTDFLGLTPDKDNPPIRYRQSQLENYPTCHHQPAHLDSLHNRARSLRSVALEDRGERTGTGVAKEMARNGGRGGSLNTCGVSHSPHERHHKPLLTATIHKAEDACALLSE